MKNTLVTWYSTSKSEVKEPVAKAGRKALVGITILALLASVALAVTTQDVTAKAVAFGVAGIVLGDIVAWSSKRKKLPTRFVALSVILISVSAVLVLGGGVDTELSLLITFSAFTGAKEWLSRK